MQKKHIIILGILALALFVLGTSLILETRKEDRQKRQTIENAKAEEITIRIIEGWDNKEIAEYLEKEGVVTAKDFLSSIKNYHTTKYSSFLPKEAEGNLEGFLFPDTYRLFASIKKEDAKRASETIINKLLENFQNKLPKDAFTKARSLNMSLYEIITLASIIEKETGRNAVSSTQKANLDKERKIITGIFYNRLKKGKALESDATINYITGKNTPAVSSKDLRINSPYNTYKYPGLPPGPISNPSLSSIQAALNPTNTDYFYFLHKQPSGEPVYSKTFKEHIQNKFKYLK